MRQLLKWWLLLFPMPAWCDDYLCYSMVIYSLYVGSHGTGVSLLYTLKVEIKKSNDLCQLPMYRMHWETFIYISKKKSWGMCMQLISLLIQPFKREHNFLSWKYAWQSGQANTLLFYINLLIKSIMVWHIHLSSLPM